MDFARAFWSAASAALSSLKSVNATVSCKPVAASVPVAPSSSSNTTVTDLDSVTAPYANVKK